MLRDATNAFISVLDMTGKKVILGNPMGVMTADDLAEAIRRKWPAESANGWRLIYEGKELPDVKAWLQAKHTDSTLRIAFRSAPGGGGAARSAAVPAPVPVATPAFADVISVGAGAGAGAWAGAAPVPVVDAPFPYSRMSDVVMMEDMKGKRVWLEQSDIAAGKLADIIRTNWPAESANGWRLLHGGREVPDAPAWLQQNHADKRLKIAFYARKPAVAPAATHVPPGAGYSLFRIRLLDVAGKVVKVDNTFGLSAEHLADIIRRNWPAESAHGWRLVYMGRPLPQAAIDEWLAEGRAEAILHVVFNRPGTAPLTEGTVALCRSHDYRCTELHVTAATTWKDVEGAVYSFWPGHDGWAIRLRAPPRYTDYASPRSFARDTLEMLPYMPKGVWYEVELTMFAGSTTGVTLRRSTAGAVATLGVDTAEPWDVIETQIRRKWPQFADKAIVLAVHGEPITPAGFPAAAAAEISRFGPDAVIDVDFE